MTSQCNHALGATVTINIKQQAAKYKARLFPYIRIQYYVQYVHVFAVLQHYSSHYLVRTYYIKFYYYMNT